MAYKLIVGLGNYPKKYENTRHNVGFLVIDELCKYLDITLNKKITSGEYGVYDEKWILAKPLTLVNLSGNFIIEICKLFNIKNDDIYIICDDLDIDIGKYQFKNNISANGHNGVRDILRKTNITSLKKIKIGIGRPQEKSDIINYVLNEFPSSEKEKIVKLIKINIIPFIINEIINI